MTNLFRLHKFFIDIFAVIKPSIVKLNWFEKVFTRVVQKWNNVFLVSKL